MNTSTSASWLITNNSDVDQLCLSYQSILPSTVRVYFIVAFATSGTMGTLLNTFLIYLFVRWNQLRKGGNKLFFSIAVADHLVTSFYSISKILQMTHVDSCVLQQMGKYDKGLLLISSTSIVVVSNIYYRRLKTFRRYHWLLRDDKPSYNAYIVVCWCSPIIIILTSFISKLMGLVVSCTLFLVYYSVYVVSYNLVVKQLFEQYKAAKTLDMAKLDRVIVSTKFKRASELIGLLMITTFFLSLPSLLVTISQLMLVVSGEHTRQLHISYLEGVGQICIITSAAVTPFICLRKHIDIRKACRKSFACKHRVFIRRAMRYRSGNKVTPMRELDS